MSMETDFCTAVSETTEVEIEISKSSKVELGESNDLNLSPCEDQEKVGEDCGDIVCDSGENSEGEVKEGSEGSFVMVSDGTGDKNSESMEEDDVFEEKPMLETEEEKKEEVVESNDPCNVEGICSAKHEDGLMEGSLLDIGGNIQGITTFDDDEKIEETKLETVEAVITDEEKPVGVADTKEEQGAKVVEPKDSYEVESDSSAKAEYDLMDGSLEDSGGNAEVVPTSHDDDEKIEDTKLVTALEMEHVQPDFGHLDNLNSSQRDCGGKFEKIEEVKLATDPDQPELHESDNLNSTQQSCLGKIESGELNLEAVMGDYRDSQTTDVDGVETDKLDLADEVVKIEESKMVPEYFDLAKSGDDVFVKKSSGSFTKEEDQELVENVSQELVEVPQSEGIISENLSAEKDGTAEETSGSLTKEESQENLCHVNNTGLEIEVTDCIHPSGGFNGASVERLELIDEEKKEDGDSSYVFVDGVYVVSHVEKEHVIDNAPNSSPEAQKEESQVYHHSVVVGTVLCRPHDTASITEVSPSPSVDARLETGNENNSSDKDEHLPTNPIYDLLTKVEALNDLSELESNESINHIGDVNLESEVGTDSRFSIRETTDSSCTEISDEKKVDEKIEEAPIFRYLIRVPRYFNDKIEEQIEKEKLEVDEKIRVRDAIRVGVEAQKAICDQYRDKFEAAKSLANNVYDALRVKRQEVGSVQSDLNSIKNANSVEEIGHRMRTMQHRIEHETISLKEEKQLIREMKQLKLQHQQLCSALEESEQLAVDRKEDKEKYLKLLKQDLDSIRIKIRQTEANIDAARKRYFDEKDKLREMQEKVRSANDNQQESYRHLQKLKKHRYDKNNYYRKYKDDERKAVEYGSGGNKETLQTHCVNQVEKFMELWNKDVDFRNDYLRCNAWSTWKRLGTSEVLALVPPKRKVRDTQTQVSVTPKASDEMNTVSQEKTILSFDNKKSGEKLEVKEEQKSETTQMKVEVEEKMEVRKEEEKKPIEEEKEAARKKEEEASIKRREQLLLEERVKAKEAEERKKRNAEKAQARAELKAQKEAEQKEKEKAKKERRKARKKASAAKEEEPPTVSNPETSAPESTITQELEIEGPKSVSKPLVFAKQAKTRIAPLPPPLPLCKKNKKRLQTWMWVLLFTAVMVVFAGVIFMPNLRSMLI